ncbi:glycoside hydrolase family 28 protein [Alteromonadaceae bacterium BrNp21-10]|nr:glycoside hydrolase family 28 protein [Alteromonadaceae bacterium BrNp21-10]
MKKFSPLNSTIAVGFLLSLSVMPFSTTAATDPSFTDKSVDQQIETIVAAIQLPNIADKDFVISDFGAVGDGKIDNAKIINNTIELAVKQGGGRVVLPAGVWLSNGPVVLKSGINLHLQQGAILLFGTEADDYLPVVKKRWEGTELYGHSPLIYARDVEDIAITGQGIIDGNNDSEFHPWQKQQQPDILALRTMGIEGVPVEQRQFGEGHYLRPALIQIFGAKRVLLEGYTSKNSPFWVNHLVYTEHATVRNIKVDSHRGNNDGIDVDSSRYVLIENSHFRTGDDSVVIKSGRDKDGRDIARPSEYIVVRNNDMGGEDGIALGSEMSGDIRYVYFTDNILRTGMAAIRFKGSNDRGGLVEHIRVRNMQIESFDNLFWFQLNYPGVLQGGHPSIYRDIIFDNITVERAGTVFEAHADPQAPIENVVLKNIRIKHADKTFVLDNIKQFQLQNVNINGEKVEGVLNWLKP